MLLNQQIGEKCRNSRGRNYVLWGARVLLLGLKPVYFWVRSRCPETRGCWFIYSSWPDCRAAFQFIGGLSRNFLSPPLIIVRQCCWSDGSDTVMCQGMSGRLIETFVVRQSTMSCNILNQNSIVVRQSLPEKFLVCAGEFRTRCEGSGPEVWVLDPRWGFWTRGVGAGPECVCELSGSSKAIYLNKYADKRLN